jgi:hypothetical protein
LEVVLMAEITKQNAAEYVVSAVGGSAPDILIGGRDETTKNLAAPNLNMSWRFGDASERLFLNFNRPGGIVAEGEVLDGSKLSLPTGDVFHFDALGRLKWDLQFNAHPGIYEWAWAIQRSEGISFHKQPAPTDAELAVGSERPPEVVGSYAVYCDQRNQYQTGKLLHIYRPIFIDANGVEEYGTLDITDNEMTVTVNQDWLDNATYPVTLDPTIGYDTMGTANIAGSVSCRGYVESDRYIASEGDAIKELHMGLRTYGSGSISVGVFDLAAGLARVAQVTLTASDALFKWRSATGLSIPLTAGHTYVLGFSTSADLRPIYDSYTLGSMRGTYGAAYTDIAAENMRFSLYGVVESGTTASKVKAFVGGSWVGGTLNIRQSGAWVPGILRRFSGGSWT